jgi:hypothetical protein
MPPSSSKITCDAEPGQVRITIPPPASNYLDTLQKTLIHISVLMALGVFYWFITALLHAPRVDAIAVLLASIFLLGPVVYGLILASAFAYRQFRPALPEVFVLSESKLTWDPGTSLIRTRWSWGDFFPREMWTTFYPKRVVQEFSPANIQTLRLRDASSGNRLTIDKDGRRWDLAFPAAHAERKWLFAALSEFYRPALPTAAMASGRVAAAPLQEHSGIIVEAAPDKTTITIPYPSQGYRDIIFRVGMALAPPLFVSWVCLEFHDLFGGPLWLLPVQIPLYLGLLLLGIFILYKAYPYAGPLKPEVFVLTPSKLIYDSGTPYLWLMFDGQWYGLENLESFYHRRRRKAEFDPVELESLSIQETKQGNKLILTQGKTKFELAGAVSEPEREWLLKTLRTHFSIESPEKTAAPAPTPARPVRTPRASASH